jgi:hypothetical protein
MRAFPIPESMASIYYDYRLGGVPQAVYGDPRDAHMRLPDEILDSVVFLVTKEKGADESEKKCRGTAFFFPAPSAYRKDIEYPYLVTAKHNIAKVIKEGHELYVRVNTLDDQSEDILIDNRTWSMSDDLSVDIAVLPFAPDPRKFRYKMLKYSMLGDAAKIEEHRIGIGDEIVISGLFTRRVGRQKNLPIVRFGNIAAMPSEPIPDSATGLDFHAYLAELRSFGGLSGSPVFVYIGPSRSAPDGAPTYDYHFLILIGVLRGHWEHREPIAIQSAFSDEMDRVNWGIAVVTPATELGSILYSERFVKQREILDRKFIERDSPVSDMADDEAPKIAPFTQEDFEDALKKASRKITPKK